MELFLQQNGQQVGPYSEERVASAVAAGQITRDDLIWHAGLTEWQPIHTVISLPTTANSVPAPNTQPPVFKHQVQPQQSNVVTTNVKQGALIGGLVCFCLGLICMFMSLFTFFLYVPFFLVAVVLSVVAMSQRRVMGGILLLVATLIVPTILGSILFVSRATPVAEAYAKGLAASNEDEATENSPDATEPSKSVTAVGAAVEEAIQRKNKFEKVRESDLKLLNELQKQKANSDKKPVMLKSFRVIQANLSKEKDSAENIIKLTIQNDTEYAVKRAYFRGILSTPGRSIPWVDDTFSYEIAGGVEPGEKMTWRLVSGMFSNWGRINIPDDAEFNVTVVKLNGSNDEELLGEDFSERDEKRLIELEKKYGNK